MAVQTIGQPGLQIEAHWIYCVWGWMKELVYSVKVVTRDALLGRILDAADRIRNSQRKLERATRAVHNRAAACVAAGGVIFENQL